jgi:hypothetical protein
MKKYTSREPALRDIWKSLGNAAFSRDHGDAESSWRY